MRSECLTCLTGESCLVEASEGRRRDDMTRQARQCRDRLYYHRVVLPVVIIVTNLG